VTKVRATPDPSPVAKPSPDAKKGGGPGVPDALPQPGATPDGSADLRAKDSVPGVLGSVAERFKRIYQHVPLTCPTCGFQGMAKIVLLNRTFHCKACRRDFHVTLRGTVPGTRPPEEGRADPGDPISFDRPNWLERWFVRLPPVARWGVLVAVVLALAGVWQLFKQAQGAPLPLDLRKRAELAGKALAQGDWHLLDRMAMPEHSDALRDWYSKFRPKELASLSLESDVSVVVGEPAEIFRRAERLPGEKKKVPIADYRTPVEIVLPGGVARLQVDFMWVKAKDGQWQIDGEWARENAELSAARQAGAPSPGGESPAAAPPPPRRRRKEN